MTESEFKRQRQMASEQLRKMNMRANESNPPVTNASSKPKAEPKNTANSSSCLPFGLDIPFLDKFKSDSDLTLIIGLLLLLIGEKADKRLLFALVYILL